MNSVVRRQLAAVRVQSACRLQNPFAVLRSLRCLRGRPSEVGNCRLSDDEWAAFNAGSEGQGVVVSFPSVGVVSQHFPMLSIVTGAEIRVTEMTVAITASCFSFVLLSSPDSASRPECRFIAHSGWDQRSRTRIRSHMFGVQSARLYEAQVRSRARKKCVAVPPFLPPTTVQRALQRPIGK